MTTMPPSRWLMSAGLLTGVAVALPACVPLVVGGAAVGTTVVATDRRSSNTVLDDQGIEMRAGRLIYDAVGGGAHVNATAWNGRLLLTGEVPNAQDKQRAEDIARQTPNVREVISDIGVMANSGLGTRSSDSFITSKVKGTLANTAGVSAKDVKVVTERGTTYLMGTVTEAEADAATEAARGVGGVMRVVRVFEFVRADQADANVVPNQPSYPRTTPATLGEDGARPVQSGSGTLASPGYGAAPATAQPAATPAPAPAAPSPVPQREPAPLRQVGGAPAPAPSAAPAPAKAPVAPAGSAAPVAAPAPAGPGAEVRSLPPLEPATSSPVNNSSLR